MFLFEPHQAIRPLSIGASNSSVGMAERKRGQDEAFTEPETPFTARCKVPKLKLGQLVKDTPWQTPAGTPMFSFPNSEMTPGVHPHLVSSCLVHNAYAQYQKEWGTALSLVQDALLKGKSSSS